MGNTTSEQNSGPPAKDFPDLPAKVTPDPPRQTPGRVPRKQASTTPAATTNRVTPPKVQVRRPDPPGAVHELKKFRKGDRIKPAAFIKVHRTWKGTVGKVFKLPNGQPDSTYGIDWDNGQHSREHGKEITFLPEHQDNRANRALSDPGLATMLPVEDLAGDDAPPKRVVTKPEPTSVNTTPKGKAHKREEPTAESKPRSPKAEKAVALPKTKPPAKPVTESQDAQTTEQPHPAQPVVAAVAKDEEMMPVEQLDAEGSIERSVQSVPVDIVDPDSPEQIEATAAETQGGPEEEFCQEASLGTSPRREEPEREESTSRGPGASSADGMDLIIASGGRVQRHPSDTVPLVPPETVDVSTPPLPSDDPPAPPAHLTKSASAWTHLGDDHSATQRGYSAFINHGVDDCRHPGMYRIIRGAILRATVDGASQKVGGVKSGTVITVDNVVDVDGRLRGHVVPDVNNGILADGWMSLCTDDGSTFWVEPWGSKRSNLNPSVFKKSRRDSRLSNQSDRSYVEGESIEIWSGRRKRWEDGQIVSRLDDGRYKVQASYEMVRMYPTRIRGARKGPLRAG